MRAEAEGRRRSITRKTDISVIVEEANTSASNQAQVGGDEDMSDADSEGEDDDDATETGQETASEAAAAGQHIAEVANRRDQAINQRIIAAWEQGHSLPPDIEQYLKEQSERGTLNANSDLRSFINNRRTSTGYIPLASPSTSSTSAAAFNRAAA